jgi:RNA polymerase sigma-70 factor (ECF subfamily)
MDGHPLASRLPVSPAVDLTARLASLFDTHYDRLYRLARRLVTSQDDALDLVQETFLRAARSPQSVPEGSASEEEAWLVRTLINLRRDQWRKSEVRQRYDATVTDLTVHTSQNPETSLIAKHAIWSALDLLPPRRRAILVLYELEALAVPSIASLLGISAITVRWHLSGGRRDLARILKNHLGGRK